MGNCCAHEERKDDNLNFGKSPALEAGDFPTEAQALKVDRMNPVASKAEPLFKALGEWKLRTNQVTSGYPHGGPFLYKNNNSSYQG